MIRNLAVQLRDVFNLLIGLTLAIVVVLLLIRILADIFKLNPFGRIYQNARRPTDEIVYRMRTSRFFFPLKRALGFDPTVVMVLVAVAITLYVIYIVSNNILIILDVLGQSLISFGDGYLFRGARYLIGTILLALILFLMSLMTIVFVNWIFGLLRRGAFWSMERLAPLLRIFEFGGIFTGWSFLILWLALNFSQLAVMAIFF
ncbi:MAG: hypothetical protein L0220_29520 [Acidobacteria bacterium]|nr:hypothetical protein [Acidobacteriota bacterium]